MSEPTKAAWRAFHAMSECNSNAQNALIIDRETGLPELVAALKHFVSSAESWKWELNAIGCKECLHDARNALRKAGEP